MTKLGSLTIEPVGGRVVLHHATSGGQQVGEVVHAPVQPQIGGAAVVVGGALRIGCATPAVFVAAPGHVAGHGMSALGGDVEPGQGQRRIGLDAVTFQQDLTEQCLGLDFPVRRSRQYQSRGTLRLFGEIAQLGGVECFLTAQKMLHQTSTQRRSRL